MERVELSVELREADGKGAARKLRAKGLVPAIVYGAGASPTPLSVERLVIDRVTGLGANQLIDLRGPGEVDGKLVLLKEAQRDPVSRELVHCDFYSVDTTKKIQVEIPIHIEGRAHGVEMGGVLEHVARVLEVRCMPLAIPETLSVNVSALDIGDSIHASDVALPDEVDLISDPTTTVIHVLAPRVEEEPEPEEAAAEGEAGAEPAEGEAAPEDEKAKGAGDSSD